MNAETLSPRQNQGTCCNLMKPKPVAFSFRVGGVSLPGFPVTLEKLSSYAKSLLDVKNDEGGPKYKIMGKKPGPKSVLMDIDSDKPEQIDLILEAGGEINICETYRPLVG